MRIALQNADKLGDFLLSLPLVGVIKSQYPDATIIAIGTGAQQALADCCELIDEFFNWEACATQSKADQVQALRELNLDVILHLYRGTSKQLFQACKAAGIPKRVGYLNSLRHWPYCNQLICSRHRDQHRSQVFGKFLKSLGIQKRYQREELETFLQFQAPQLDLNSIFQAGKKRLIIHPGSSSTQACNKEWPLSYFTALIDQLPDDIQVILTGTEAEAARFPELVQHPKVTSTVGLLSLTERIALIDQADLTLACSTGILHIAGALNKPLIGLYLSQPSTHPNRFGPLGQQGLILIAKTCSFCQKNEIKKAGFGAACTCMHSIEPDTVLNCIRETISLHQTAEVSA